MDTPKKERLNKMPLPKNKYRKGRTIYSGNELMEYLRKGRWVYLQDKVIHPGRLRRMSLSTVDHFLHQHIISEAIDQWQE